MATTSERFSENEGGGASRSRSRRRRIIIVCIVVAVLVVVAIAVAVVHIQSSIVVPGLTVHPEELLVFRSDERENDYTKELNNYAKAYEQPYETSGQHLMECSPNNPPYGDNVCVFQLTWLTSNCQVAEHWGYYQRTPCILLTPNKVADWVPEPYTRLDELPDTMPEKLKDEISAKYVNSDGSILQIVWVSCEPAGVVTREYMGELQMSPWPGFPAYYFPYKDIPGYMEPIVAVQFNGLASHVALAFNCRMWAKNIDPLETTATVEILMD